MSRDQPDLQFGAFVLSVREGRLTKDGADVALTPKAFDTLVYLASRAGEMVEKQELMKAVWEDVFVDDSTLTQNIFTIRKTLGDASYIETIPRKGYRFSTKVLPLDRVVAETESPRQFPWRGIAAGSLVLIAILGVVWWRVSPAASLSTAKISSIAVLPLRNLSGDPEQEFFSDGTTEALITDLAQIHSLAVTSRTSVMQYKSTVKSAPQIGKELGVDALVEGSVQRSGGRVRITAQLIRASTDKHIWASEYERDATDVLQLEAEVASAIVREIRGQISPEERGRLAKAGPVNPQAYEDYLLAAHHYSRRTRAETRRAIEYYEKAVQLQPDYAPAWAGLGQARQWLTLFGNTAELRASARNASSKALELDPNLADSHEAMGSSLFGEWNWSGAEKEFKRALELDPNSLMACECYGNLLLLTGRTREALAFIDVGRKADPLSPAIYSWAAWAMWISRRYSDSITYQLHALELDPHLVGAQVGLALAYQKLNRAAEAAAPLEKDPELRGSAELAIAYALAGRPAEARRLLDSLTKPEPKASSVDIARLYFALGDRDHGFEWLGKAIDQHELMAAWAKVSPFYDDVRSDPRFVALMARVNLPN